jgi:hypothetical protein
MCWRKLSCLLLVLAQKSSRLTMSDSLDDSPASLTASRFLRIKRRDCSSSASCKSKSSRFRAGLSLNSVRDEKPYENALVVEFGLRGIPVVQQRRYDVLYKTIKVGEIMKELTFDHDALPKRDIQFVKQTTREVAMLLERSTGDIIAIGQKPHLKIPRSTLYLLAANSTPDALRDEFVHSFGIGRPGIGGTVIAAP